MHMTPGRWRRLMAVGVLLLIVGMALPMLMIVGVLPTPYPLNFLAFGASVSGLFIGSYSVREMVHESRRRDE